MILHRGDGTEFEPQGFATVHAGRAVRIVMDEVHGGAVDETITFRATIQDIKCLENEIMSRLEHILKDYLGQSTFPMMGGDREYRISTEDYGGPNGDGGRIIVFKWWPGSLPEILSVEWWSN